MCTRAWMYVHAVLACMQCVLRVSVRVSVTERRTWMKREIYSTHERTSRTHRQKHAFTESQTFGIAEIYYQLSTPVYNNLRVRSKKFVLFAAFGAYSDTHNYSLLSGSLMKFLVELLHTATGTREHKIHE